VKKQLKVLTLNYDWDYTPSYKKTFVKTFPKSVKVNIPHTNIELPFNNFNEKDYQFISSYQKIFEIKKVKNKRYTLHFEGVMAYAEVYVNNELVVSHKGGYTPFKAEITELIKNGENKIFVMVDSTERNDFPPHGNVVDYLTYGGIYREVYIEEHELNYIENAFIDVIADTLEVRMMIDFASKKSSVFKFNIYKEDKIVHTFEREYDLREKINVHSVLDFERWTLENPVSYHLEILMDGKVSYSSRFAKRSVLFNTEGFFLNKKHIKLRGLNRHQSYPYVGYAMPSNAQRKDADILKYELGCNIVRSSHYPPSTHFLDRCDEIGLLVFNEIPGWQHIGDKEWQKVAQKNVSEMIHRDYNHPSVIIWGVRINESPDNDALYKATNKIAKDLDPYRPTGGVRNMKGSKFFEDVYTYNDFVHRGNNKGLEKAKSISKKKVPYLVTEYNGHMYPTKKTDDEYHRVYQAKRHLKVQNDSYKYPEIAGAIGWCMFDYNTHKDFGSGDKICYHGVMDMFRIPKFAAAAYRSQWDKNHYLEVLSNLNIGEQEASEIREVYVMTNADSIKFYINDDFIDYFYPSEKYSDLPHPPIIIDDFIGNLIHENEDFSPKDCDRVKKIFKQVMKHGTNFPFRYKFMLAFFLFRNKLKFDDAAKLYEKYIGKWGSESTFYKFEAYIDKKLVATKIVGTSYKNDLHAKVDDTELTETDTYQTTRIVVKHLDKHLNTLHYSNEVISVKVKGPLELIGPSNLALLGGSTGFYLKTTGELGEATITISSNHFEDKIVTVNCT